MFLVEILLPVYDNNKHPFEKKAFDQVRKELTDHFGGVTAFVRSPAEGAWRVSSGIVTYDDVFIFEVMTQEIDRAWWSDYKMNLEDRFKQEELVIRSIVIERL